MLSIPMTATAKSGIRPVNIRHDLDGIADLIEVCFADNMDSLGRATVQEMRFFSRLGAFLWVARGLDSMIQGLMHGFVWIENERVIGNVSLYYAGYDHTWVIANVAVYPEYRGQGIASQLCEAAINRVLEWRGKTVILQVDAANDTAQHVYQRLGFRAERVFSRWYRSGNNRPPHSLENMPSITYPSFRESQAQYDLINIVRPTHRGGIGWLKPIRTSDFRFSLWRLLFQSFSPTAHETWIIRSHDSNRFDAMVKSESGFAATSLRFDLFVHPEKQGELEKPLVNYVLRRATDQFRGAITDHPDDDEYALQVFEDYNFQLKRRLIHMRLEI